MNSKLKAAIIGYGYMGEIRHRMVDQHDSAELVMICDNDTSKIKSNPDCKIVTDPSDVINSDVDIVVTVSEAHRSPYFNMVSEQDGYVKLLMESEYEYSRSSRYICIIFKK